MGLDMYLNGRKFMFTDWKNPENNRTEDSFRVSNVEIELAYWRKHPNLHGFIVDTFAEGKDECQEIELDVGKMRQIIEAVKGATLPHTTGFFFGASEGTPDERNDDINFFEAAIRWLEEKQDLAVKSVFYRASW